MKFISVLCILLASVASSFAAATTAAVTAVTSFADAIYITSPDGASVFDAGKAALIQWKYTAFAAAAKTVTIAYINQAVNDQTLTAIVAGIDPTVGTYSWLIPATYNSSFYYQIAIGTAADSSYSHGFEILGVGIPSSLPVFTDAVPTGPYSYNPDFVIPGGAGSSSVAVAASSSAPAVVSSVAPSSSLASVLSSVAPSSSVPLSVSQGAKKMAGSNAMAALAVLLAVAAIIA
jgi:hypothetical protein